MFEKLFGPIEKLITEHGSAAILRERIVALKETMEQLVQDNDHLREELNREKEKCDELQRQLDENSVPEDFTEHRGVLFRRMENDEFQDEAYCPNCKIPMVSAHDLMNFRCSDCKRLANFTGMDLPKIMKELE